MTVNQCAACGSSRVRPSRQADPMDKIHTQSGKVPWRCRDCRVRFYSDVVTEEAAVTRHHPHRRRSLRTILKGQKRALISSGIFLLLIGLFLICLAYMARDHGDSQTSLQYPPAGFGGLPEIRTLPSC